MFLSLGVFLFQNVSYFLDSLRTKKNIFYSIHKNIQNPYQ